MDNYMKHIEINSDIMFGKPVIKGTRITIELILDELGAGKSKQTLVDSHINLELHHIDAALQFASDALKGERTYAVSL